MDALGGIGLLGVLLLGVLPTVLWIWALVDVARREFRQQNDKVIWVLVICLGGFIGAIVYFAFGRQMEWGPGERRFYRVH